MVPYRLCVCVWCFGVLTSTAPRLPENVLCFVQKNRTPPMSTVNRTVGRLFGEISSKYEKIMDFNEKYRGRRRGGPPESRWIDRRVADGARNSYISVHKTITTPPRRAPLTCP